MTDQLAEIVESAAEYLSCEGDASFRFDYSGRAMYGATCVGIVHDVSAFAVARAIVAAAIDADADVLDVLDDLARAAREDSMGRSAILYFPGIEATDAQRERVASES